MALGYRRRWGATLNVRARYGRVEFSGDTLSFWCYAEEPLTAEQSPRIYLNDSNGTGRLRSL